MGAEHKFSFRAFGVEHSGLMDDDVAEWFSALLVMEGFAPKDIVVPALKGALRLIAEASS